MLVDSWPALFLGWPAVAASLLLAIVGIGRRVAPLVAAAAVVAAPFAFYVTGLPRWGPFAGPWIPVSLLLAAWAVRRGTAWIAWILLLPYLVLVGVLAVAVACQ